MWYFRYIHTTHIVYIDVKCKFNHLASYILTHIAYQKGIFGGDNYRLDNFYGWGVVIMIIKLYNFVCNILLKGIYVIIV